MTDIGVAVVVVTMNENAVTFGCHAAFLDQNNPDENPTGHSHSHIRHRTWRYAFVFINYIWCIPSQICVVFYYVKCKVKYYLGCTFYRHKNMNESAFVKVPPPKYVDMEKINSEVAPPLLTLYTSALGV